MEGKGFGKLLDQLPILNQEPEGKTWLVPRSGELLFAR